MKTLRLLPILLLMLTFTACREKDKTPESIDISKYVLVGKMKYQNSDVPFLLSLSADGKVDSYSPFRSSSSANATYIFEGGLLTLNLGGSSAPVELKISDEKIVSSTAEPGTYYMLVKTPETNQLTGKTYSGGRRETTSLVSYLSNFKFTDSQYGENSLNAPVPDKNYASIKNIAALTVNGTTQHFWILINDKLEYGGFNSSNQKVYVGSYSQRQ
jgi:hypothetical protein